jgi:hypothetical protein
VCFLILHVQRIRLSTPVQIYIHLRGASALLVSTSRAMREPQSVERVMELAPRSFVSMGMVI